jgi:membrane-bound transcription factor site-1 protease
LTPSQLIIHEIFCNAICAAPAGWLALHITVRDEAADFEGVAQGHITLSVESPRTPEDNPQEFISTVNLPIRVKIIPTPPRHRRLLWDQFHNLR